MGNVTTQTTTPGLHIEWQRVGSGNLYATLLHKPTGAIIRKFTHDVILGGKRRFAATVTERTSGIDWLRSAEDLVADRAARDAVYSIPYDCRAGAP